MSKQIHKITHPTGTMQWLTNPGGAIVTKAMNNGRTYQGPLGALANPYGPAPKTDNTFDPGDRVGSSINGQQGVDQPAMRLGWTNGGYNYHNSPFNGQPITPANPMSFAPPQNGGMTASGPQQMLPGAPGGGTLPLAGAQPPPIQGPPPTGNGGTFGVPEQEALLRGLRRA